MSPHPDTIAAFATRLASRRPELAADAPRHRAAARATSLDALGSRYWGLRLQHDENEDEFRPDPAQYITLSIQGCEPRFIALASAPHEPSWLVIIDRHTTLGTLLDTFDAHGAPLDTLSLEVSKPEGPGFPLHTLDDPIVALTTGSGIATMRSVFESLRHVSPERLQEAHLYYGERDELAVALQPELDAWRELGVQIYHAFDTPQEPWPWRYVQHALVAHPPESEELRQGSVLLSGSSVMLRSVGEELLRLGVAPEKILLNV